MKLRITFILLFGTLLNLSYGQETINANDANTYIQGGDQKANVIAVDLTRIAIVDVEPDPNDGVNFGGSGSLMNLEAGLPPPSSGSGEVDDLWLNYTYRGNPRETAQIFVLANQPIPTGIRIGVEIISAAPGGRYEKTQKTGIVRISDTKQVIINPFSNGFTSDGIGHGFQLRYTVQNPYGLSLPPGFEIYYIIE